MFWNNKKIILQYASRRGGSTILAQLLEAENGVGSIDQPFDLWKPTSERGKVINSHIPNKAMSQFFELDAVEKEEVKQYMQKIYKKKLIQLSNKPKCKELVLKIVNAQGLIDDLSKMVPSLSIVFLRHPCSQAMSVVKNKWGTCEKPFLESEEWTTKYLSKRQLEFGRSISKEGSYIARAVLNWCLEWHFVLNYSQGDFLIFHYEDMVLKPKEFVSKLFAYLNFSSIEKALAVMGNPSRSSHFSTIETIENIKEGNKEKLLNNWRESFTVNDLKIAQQILNVFEVNKYSITSNIPLV